MRVHHIIPSVSDVHGGPTEILALMEESLSAAGVSVTTATTDDEGPGCRLPIESRPAELHGAKRIYFRKLLDFYKVAPTMLPWLWHNVPSFDVVHIHALFSFTSVAAALVASWRGVPYIVRPLGTLNQYGMTQRRPWLKRLSMAMLESRILRRAAAVHFTSETEWEEAKALNLSLRGIVIPLAVRPGEQGKEQSLLEQHPALRGRQIVLYLSRLDPKKNIEGLLRAFASVRAERDHVALLIAGGGPADYVATLKTLATKLEPANSFFCPGSAEPPGSAPKARAFSSLRAKPPGREGPRLGFPALWRGSQEHRLDDAGQVLVRLDGLRS